MFIFIDWAIGYTLKSGAEWFKGNVLFRKDLLEALNNTAENWNEELPQKFRIDKPETLFNPATASKENLDSQPHLMTLRNMLQEGLIPEPETWAQAALEHVRFVRRKLDAPESDIWIKSVFGHIQSSVRRALVNDVNSFCEADEAEIMPHLNELGRRLTLTIMQDVKTTLPLIYLQLQSLELIHLQLQRIESKLEQLPTVSSKRDLI